MSELAGKTKRALNKATTTKSQLNSGLNQEFVDTRRRLDDINGAIKRLSKSISVSRQSWTAVARQQRDFTQSLSNSFPQSGEVQSYAAEVAQNLRDVQKEIVRSDAKEAPHQQIVSVLDQYLEVLKSIQAEYNKVEEIYTEKVHYQKKVDRLEKKSNSNRKHADKLTRNVEKLDTAQKGLDEKVAAILERMRSAFQKHEAVLQCAHHSFWMANNTHLGTIEQATHDIRAESVAVHKLLLGLDMSEDKLLMPVPRPTNLIEGPSSNVQTILAADHEKDEVRKEDEHVDNRNSTTEVVSDDDSISDVVQDDAAISLKLPTVPVSFPAAIPNKTVPQNPPSVPGKKVSQDSEKAVAPILA